MRICVFGGRIDSPGYPRNLDVAQCLEELGQDVVWCTLPIPRYLPRLPLAIRLFLLTVYTPFRWTYAIGQALFQHLRGRIDLVFVPFPSHLDIPPAWLLARLLGIPLIADIFLSIFETFVEDRKVIRQGGGAARILFSLERSLLKLPDRTLIDTEHHRMLVGRTFGDNLARMHVVPLGIRESVFTYEPPAPSNRIVFWGTYIKLHGIDQIIRAAAHVRNIEPKINFELIGRGQELKEMKGLARELNATNVSFVEEFLPIEVIANKARTAFCALGIFGRSAKSASVVPYKVVQALALGIPVVTADTPAAREVLTDRESAILVREGRYQDLAEALIWLYSDRNAQLMLSENGRRVFESRFSHQHIMSMVRRAFT